MIKHYLTAYRADWLTLGFVGRSCSFEHRPYSDRSAEARAAYDRLRASLESEGLKDPLITYKGHVLIGMRRFEILRESRLWFPCIEVDEPVEDWRSEDIDRLTAFVRGAYGCRHAQFIG